MARRSTRQSARRTGELPSKEEILAFVRSAKSKVGKREIARAFGIKGGGRAALKHLLKELADEGVIGGVRSDVRARGDLPPVTVLEIIERDVDGELIGVPIQWDEEEAALPRVLVAESGGSQSMRGRTRGQLAGGPIGVGDRVLAEVRRATDDDDLPFGFIASVMKRLPRTNPRKLGVLRLSRSHAVIEPVDRKALREWPIARGDTADAEDGDLVRFELIRSGRMQVPQARVVEVIGNPSDQRQISLIAIHAHGIPDEFPPSVLEELESLPELSLEGREDLRSLPLITIDPADARDHDDAVHAALDESENNPGGFVVTVAIADVAFYVRPGTKLDIEARRRGNSCYFPDRVVPMLPEKISNDLCSLRPDEDRPCLSVRMVFDRNGRKRSHAFRRAVMRSHLKLSYEQAQAAFDGHNRDLVERWGSTVLKPLWVAYQALNGARDQRSPLELDVPERRIRLANDGRVHEIHTPERLEAHRLIEELMIQANVAAAETLDERSHPAIYRVHDQPSKEKLQGLRDFLGSLSMKLAASNNLRPSHFNRILEQARSLPVPEIVNEVVLRSQSQAVYDVENIGHFGLNLQRYAHFTSPIRRYADLIVHRALIAALGFGADGLPRDAHGDLRAVADEISDLERRAMAAERETVDRLTAAFLADRLGQSFTGRVSGATRSGLFIRLDETGADGFVPISSLEGFHDYDETQRALVSRRNNTGYQLGDAVDVRLVEALPMAGALRFEMLTPGRKFETARRSTSLRGRRRLRHRSSPPRRNR